MSGLRSGLACALVLCAASCAAEDSGDEMGALQGDDDAAETSSTGEPTLPQGAPSEEGSAPPPAPSPSMTDEDDEPPPPVEPDPTPFPRPDPRPVPMNPPPGSGGTAGSGESAGSGGESDMSPFPFPGFPAGGSAGAGDPGMAGAATGGSPEQSGGSGGMGIAGQGGGGECVPDYDCEPVAPDSGDYYADCVARVNQFRACVCLTPLERNYEAEACLDQQAEYDSDQDQAHAGFSDGVCMPGGNSQNECPGWGNAPQVVEGCIQQMFDEGPPPQQPCDGQCYQEHGHFINMTDTEVASVACGMFDGDNGFWAVQNFFRSR